MGILLKTTTVAGVVGAVYGTTSFDGGFDSDEAFAVTSSLVLSTATTVGLNIANAKLDKDIADKYATAMVEGMSDDQLAAACDKLNLMYADGQENGNDNVHKL